MIRILGIDPGTALVGWGIIDHDAAQRTHHVVAYGHIKTESKNSRSERLAEIHDNVLTIINTYHPHEAAVEELFYFKNAKTVIAVAEARGVILHTCFAQKLLLGEYTPLQIKQSITGYGRAQKKQMQEMIKNVLKLKQIPQPDDTADALAVALCHANSRVFTHTINARP